MPFSTKPNLNAVTSQLNGQCGDWDSWKEWEPTDPDNPQSAYDYIALSSLTDDSERLKHLKAGNFGLATLYYQYLDDKKDYMRSVNRYHCPNMQKTAGVDRGEVLKQANANDAALSDYRVFDPLWAKYNTYDVTYNYDQFQNLILDYDDALGYGEVNIKRQLHFTTPPADTVVCWCYGHTRAQRPITVIEKADASVNTEQERRAAEAERASEVNLVLWADGTVLPVRPYLAQKKSAPVYYWVPPFLYSPGDARR
jgi:hypothetical protein